MSRTRSIPDARVFAVIHELLASGGEKAVSFSTVAAASGLAAPTLAQRFGSRDGMVRAARLAAWEALAALTSSAIAETEDKGPQALLKALGVVDPAPLVAEARDPEVLQCAAAWRASVEAALSLRLGTGPKARESAALVFAVWQGQLLWARAGEPGFRLKDMVRRLT
jgi:AcrR family transcriptional regulator